MEKYIPWKWEPKKAGVAILISDKIGLKIKNITRDKEGHYLMIKWSIQEEDIAIVNIYASNTGTSQYIREILTDIKEENDSNIIIIIVDFNTSLTPVDISSKQKTNKGIQVLNDALDEMDLTDIFRTLHPNAEEYTFFSSAHGTFSRIDHILGHKSNLSKFKKTEIVSSIFSDHNAMSVCECEVTQSCPTLCDPMDRSSKQKINKETHVLNDTLEEMDLIDIFRTFHPNAKEYTSQVHMEHCPG